jgi:hypothetical protein
MSGGRQSGQAAVEFAILLPLLMFMLLGSLQLFLLGQARIMAQYAVSRATRMGSINHANCNAMIKPALMVVLPSITSRFASAASPGAEYANQVRARLNNRYLPGRDGERRGPIVWIDRIQPLRAEIGPDEEEIWNLAPPAGPGRILEVRMIFWAPLKIPFANWVIARMALAHWNLRPLNSADPLAPTKRNANWVAMSNGPAANIKAELERTYDAGEYVFPVETTYAMRMMSPVRMRQQNCQ